MATNKSVVVLAPNGRRQNVKVSPNTTILQILEEVCKKQGLEVKEYDVKHHNKVLDATSTVFYTGLPNNAQLELSPAVKQRLEGEVTLALNLESGQRLMGSFTPDNTLWEVVEKLCPEEADLGSHPVVIYMRNEIYGAELKKTILRSLGLTGGRAMLRLIHRSPDELRNQPSVSTPLPSKPVEEKPYVRKMIKVESPERPERQKSPERSSNTQTTTASGTSEVTKEKEVLKKKAPNIVDMIKSEKKQKVDAFPTGQGYVLGTTPVTKTEKMEEMDIQDTASEGSVSSAQIETEFMFLGERNAMIFSLDTAESVPSSELPDDFFELTIDDARKILRDIKLRRQEYENGQLVTSAWKKMEEDKKQLRQLNRYKKAVIRIAFPDGTVLQGTFVPTDTIATVMDFVRGYLENKNTDFYLYTTPPKEVLNSESRLIEVHCVPGALLHFGTDSQDTKKKYLRHDLYEKFTTNSVASLAAKVIRKQNTRKDVNLVEDMQIDDLDANVGASTSKASKETPIYQDYEDRTPAAVPEKVPKWFKIAK